MNYRLNIVPPGGGEVEYGYDIESDRIPQTGEYIFVPGDANGFLEVFLVRYVQTFMERRPKTDVLLASKVEVEAEYISHPYQTDYHARAIERFAEKGKVAKEYPESGY